MPPPEATSNLCLSLSFQLLFPPHSILFLSLYRTCFQTTDRLYPLAPKRGMEGREEKEPAICTLLPLLFQLRILAALLSTQKGGDERNFFETHLNDNESGERECERARSDATDSRREKGRN